MLLLYWLLSQILEFFDWFTVHLKSMHQRYPFCSLYEPVCFPLDFTLISNVPQVDVNVIRPKCTLYTLLLSLIFVTAAIICLWSIRWPKMVITLKSLMPFSTVFKFKLYFWKCWTKLETNLVHCIWSETIVGPSEQDFVSLVLQFMLSPLVVICKIVLSYSGVTLVSNLFKERFLQIVCK